MDPSGVAVLLLFVFHVKKSAECSNDDMFAMAGCDVSITWTLGKTPIKVIRALVYHSSNKTADLAHGECKVMDNSSTYCNTSKHDDEWILSLTISNVTEQKSGIYILQLYGPDLAKNIRSKKLIIIGKPTLMELRKPILNQPFEMICSAPFGLECFIYRWKMNGSEITPFRNVNTHYVSSLRIIDNFRQVRCQVCLNETASNFSSELCKHDACSADSDPYEIEAIYGPDTISLSLNESNFYLKEHEPFTIDCFANCNPSCTFRWIGIDTINGEKLAITNFQPRIAGQYTCYVTNQQTNITSKSNPIILHHEKEDKHKAEIMGDFRLIQYWMGPVIVSVLLLIVGFLMLVTYWRKNTSRAIDSGELCQPCAGQTNGGVSQTKLGSSSRSLPNTSVQKNVSRRTKGLKYPNVQTNSSSLQNFSNQRESFRNQLGENVPLRTLFQASHTTKYQTRNAAISHDSEHKNSSEQDLRQDNSAANLQEDPYSTIDEDAMSVYDHGIDNLFENNSHETGRSTEQLFYDYARSIEIYNVEPGNVHVTDDTYLTPISDLSRPFEIFQDEETNVLGTDENYITPISDLACPIELCENEEINVLGTDQRYIPPINDFANPFEICQAEETDMIETDTTYITIIG